LSNPKYVPSDWSVGGRKGSPGDHGNSGRFGKEPYVEWYSLPDTDAAAQLALRAQRNAAYLQYNYAFRIRQAMKRQRITMKSYAVTIGQDRDRISRILRGASVMTLEDIAMADAVLKNIIANPEPLLPFRIDTQRVLKVF
jgi:hypothetical protein